ncbi:hypothetical protein JF729_07105 [Mycobacterium intracellulare]|uniref:hypothetical protein n=1 Tax=Mycobacterium intracellulare TaxID=1767 RepID=UPI001CD97BED|nr:hypothetical protein [Mycobacterium intracellulare]MCA2247564.1 hypothetical protein [Mycobacterium intracellulare]
MVTAEIPDTAQSVAGFYACQHRDAIAYSVTLEADGPAAANAHADRVEQGGAFGTELDRWVTSVARHGGRMLQLADQVTTNVQVAENHTRAHL